RDKERLATLRLITAEFKRSEVDERIGLDDTRVLAILDKMVKQRNDSVEQYKAGGREDLADKETAEVGIIQEFMPAALADEELQSIIDDAIAEAGATSMKDMGNVMKVIRPKVQGRADMGEVSNRVKGRLQ
ncbi:MAG: GatB/YqeY domain-containing protein, partial [Pseudomonadales bacterium]|nr:GatB/YqeY domain-containing protein [Pseudomonadales bacterium]